MDVLKYWQILAFTAGLIATGALGYSQIEANAEELVKVEKEAWIELRLLLASVDENEDSINQLVRSDDRIGAALTLEVSNLRHEIQRVAFEQDAKLNTILRLLEGTSR